jgi:hypothetical protein
VYNLSGERVAIVIFWFVVVGSGRVEVVVVTNDRVKRWLDLAIGLKDCFIRRGGSTRGCVAST